MQKPSLAIAGRQFTIEIVDTPDTRRQGLSGRESLDNNSAMLFVFDTQKQVCFWMKDMRFSIDIVWLNDAKQVVAIEENVSPESYPANFCHSGRYVAEFKAGTVQQSGIALGDQADL